MEDLGKTHPFFLFLMGSLLCTFPSESCEIISCVTQSGLLVSELLVRALCEHNGGKILTQ